MVLEMKGWGHRNTVWGLKDENMGMLGSGSKDSDWEGRRGSEP